MLKLSVIIFIVFGYISLLFFAFLGFLGGAFFGIGELGSVSAAIVILPIPFIIEVISSIYYYKKYKTFQNKFLYFLRFSILLFIFSTFGGYIYMITEMENTENYLTNAGNMVDEYKKTNGLDFLTEEDFNNIMLPKDIEVRINDDNYSLKYKYGTYFDGSAHVRRP